MDPDQARAKRIFWIVVITLVVEVGLYIVGILGPALRGLTRPVYLLVLIVALITIWHALRRRPGHDRRHGDRRSRTNS
ncbi:MAG TPA: hypothetical protein VGM50_08950 [Gemmatimonadaceae bacterium]|jgi:hypothetical protein